VRERPHHAPCKQPNRGNLTYYAPPYGGGEGGGAVVCSMRERIVLCEKDTLIKQTENVRIFHNPYPSLFEDTLFLNEEEALQHSRACLSWNKNMPLLMQEGYVLKRCL